MLGKIKGGESEVGTISKRFYKIEGGCTFGFMIKALLKENNVEKVRLYKDWRNKETIFVINGTKFNISDHSYIHNYDGFIELEEYNGAVRTLSDTITSSYEEIFLKKDDYFYFY